MLALLSVTVVPSPPGVSELIVPLVLLDQERRPTLIVRTSLSGSAFSAATVSVALVLLA